MRQRQESKNMNVKDKNQNEVSGHPLVNEEGGYEYKGDFFEDPVWDAVNGVLYAKHERDPRYWNYALSIKGAKKLITFCRKYIETRRHGWQETKELLETKLSGMYPYCSFADFNRLRNSQTTDDIKKGIKYSKASEELSGYADEFEAVLIIARRHQETFEKTRLQKQG